MNRLRMVVVPVMLVALFSPALWAAFSPWDALTVDSWVNPNVLTMRTVNGGDYRIGFDVSQSNHVARGMNALKFSYTGNSTGHLQSIAPTGSFTIQTTGSQTFTDVILLVAIDRDTLPSDFSFSLGRAGQTAYQFNPAADFGFYNHPEYATGRPSGYYSNTSPASEPISYAFSQGMVTAWAVSGANLSSTNSLTINYAFDNLPGTAVFNVYGYLASAGWIQHTNRALADANNPAGAISTFEVVPEPAVITILVAGMGLSIRRRRL